MVWSAAERYPPERWDRLFTLLYLKIEQLRRKMGLESVDDLLNTRFCQAYVSGYADSLAEEDEQFAGFVRRSALGFVYGASKGLDENDCDSTCRAIFQSVMARVDERDPQTVIGYSCGSSDGERFFELVAADEHPYTDEIVEDLFAMADAGKIDISQTA